MKYMPILTYKQSLVLPMIHFSRKSSFYRNIRPSATKKLDTYVSLENMIHMELIKTYEDSGTQFVELTEIDSYKNFSSGYQLAS
jgi:hypothetical protein